MSLEVYIASLDSHGHGRTKALIGTKERTLVIPGTLPTEIVRITPCKTRRSRVFFASVESIVQPSHDRIVSACPHAGVCGGCTLQHMSYESQRCLKERMVHGLFASYANQNTVFERCLGADQTSWYRNKMEYTFSQDASGRRFLGLFAMMRRRKVEAIHACTIGPSWAPSALKKMSVWWEQSGLLAYNPHKDTGSLRTLTLRSSARTNEHMLILTVSSRPEWALAKKDLQSFVEVARALEEMHGGHFSVVLRIHQAVRGHQTQFYELVLYGQGVFHETYDVYPKEGILQTMQLQFSPQSFCQPNTKQAERIYSEALSGLMLEPDDIFWDLFCGVGGFGCAAAPFVKKVVSIELSHDAVFDATCNKEHLKLENIDIQKGDVFTLVKSQEQMKRLGLPTKIVVDPPRAGLGRDVIELLTLLSPHMLAYVSCNPESQQKDMEEFHRLGWILHKVLPIDQFPNTPHVENILFLKN